MMNNTTKKDPSGLWLLCLGAFFLFNPTYHIIDVLPDAVGYLLFFTGLSKLSMINDEALEARRAFNRLFIIECARLCLYAALPYATGLFVLICAFIIAAGEAILFIPAVSHMFKGFDFLDMRMNCTAARELRLRRKTLSLTSLRNLTSVAFIIRAVGSVLPLLPTLALNTNTVLDQADTENTEFLSLLIYGAVIIIGLAVGIPWLCRFTRYIKGISADRECCQKISDASDVWKKNNHIRIVSDNMNAVMLLLITASAFCLNMYVDGVNIFPTGIGALLVLAAFVLLREHGKAVAVSGSIVCALWAAASVAGEYLQMDYRANNYRPGSAEHMIGKAPEMYFKMELCGYIEAALMAVAMLLMLLLFTRTLDKHAKKYAFYNMQEKKRFDRCLIPVIILWVLAALMSAAIIPVMKFFAEIWLINGLLTAVLVIFMIRAYNILYDGIYLKLHE